MAPNIQWWTCKCSLLHWQDRKTVVNLATTQTYLHRPIKPTWLHFYFTWYNWFSHGMDLSIMGQEREFYLPLSTFWDISVARLFFVCVSWGEMRGGSIVVVGTRGRPVATKIFLHRAPFPFFSPPSKLKRIRQKRGFNWGFPRGVFPGGGVLILWSIPTTSSSPIYCKSDKNVIRISRKNHSTTWLMNV